MAAWARGARGTGLCSALRGCSGAREGRRAVPAGWGDHSEEALRCSPDPAVARRGLRGTSPEGAHESTHAG